MRSSRTRLQRECSSRGFTYLTVLFILAFLSGGLALVGEVWHTAARREKEAELLFVGSQYRKAIERYFLNGPRQYPRNLSDLLKDPRKPTTERYLRQIYPDPITGKNEWGIVKAPDGGIMGVHSLSEEPPLKLANFSRVTVVSSADPKYSDWKFVPAPEELSRRAAPDPQRRVAAPPVPTSPPAPGR